MESERVTDSVNKGGDFHVLGRESEGVVTREWNNMVIIVCLGRVGKEMRGGGKKGG
jgi:hypothetical protein